MSGPERGRQRLEADHEPEAVQLNELGARVDRDLLEGGLAHEVALRRLRRAHQDAGLRVHPDGRPVAEGDAHAALVVGQAVDQLYGLLDHAVDRVAQLAGGQTARARQRCPGWKAHWLDSKMFRT